MGVDVKGVVKTDIKDVFMVAKLVSAYTDWLMAENTSIKTRPLNWKELFKPAEVKMEPTSEYFTVSFMLHGEARQLFVFMDCDNDCLTAVPAPHKRIVLSMGAFGISASYMEGLLSFLRVLGPTFLNRNDAFDSWEELYPLKQISLMDLGCNMLEENKSISGVYKLISPRSLETWATKVDRIASSLPVGTDRQMFIGLSNDELTDWRNALDSILENSVEAAKTFVEYLKQYQEGSVKMGLVNIKNSIKSSVLSVKDA